MKEKNGFLYSTTSFEGYKFRLIFKIRAPKVDENVDVYTTNPSKEDVGNLLMEAVRKKYENINLEETGIIHWCTVEQDELTAKFIDETLNSI